MPAPRFPRILATALAALLLAAPAPARALDAQALYEKIKGSVAILYILDETRQPRFHGTGFVIGDGTLVVTNQHVAVRSSTLMRVETFAGRVVDNARVLRMSSDSDLAVLRIPEALPPLELSSGKAGIGQEVAVLGNPSGFMGTMSTGIVSGYQTIPRWGDVIQTSAPISPGSSGSPLLDGNGQVLGVMCAMRLKEQNINFAVPVEKLRKLLGRDLAPAGENAPAAPAAAPAQSSGSLEVREGGDGSITIIQKRKPQQ